MSKIKSISNHAAGKLATVAGASLAASGVVILTHPHASSSTDVGDWAGYLMLSLFGVALAAMAPVFFALARHANSRRAEQAAAVAGAAPSRSRWRCSPRWRTGRTTGSSS
jgi:hypothetical protein